MYGYNFIISVIGWIRLNPTISQLDSQVVVYLHILYTLYNFYIIYYYYYYYYFDRKVQGRRSIESTQSMIQNTSDTSMTQNMNLVLKSFSITFFLVFF